MTPRDLIEALGGTFAVADALGVTPQAVTNMKARGTIPARRLLPLWRLARERGVDWSPDGAPDVDRAA